MGSSAGVHRTHTHTLTAASAHAPHHYYQLRLTFVSHSPFFLFPFFPAQFILADAAVTPNFQPFGVLLVAGALFADAFVGNTQESLFA
jgi:hypothetical protein